MAGLSATPVNTCSISFADPKYNESEFARMVAERYHTNHRTEQVDSEDFDLIDTLAHLYDEPYADSSAIPTYRVCQLARKHVTVALSGDGGDETFGGYRRYRLHMMEERMRASLPASIRQPLFGLLGRVYPKADWAPRMFRAKTTFQGMARTSVEAYFHSMSIVREPLREAVRAFDRERAEMGVLAQEIRDAATAMAAVRYLHATRAIHEVLSRAAHNSVLASSISVIHSLSRRFWYAYIEDTGGFPENSEIHATTLAAIIAGAVAGLKYQFWLVERSA